jgi:hypothetical protein
MSGHIATRREDQYQKRTLLNGFHDRFWETLTCRDIPRRDPALDTTILQQGAQPIRYRFVTGCIADEGGTPQESMSQDLLRRAWRRSTSSKSQHSSNPERSAAARTHRRGIGFGALD